MKTTRLAVASLLTLLTFTAAAEPLKTLAVLPFSLLDDQHDLVPATVEYERVEKTRDQLEREIDAAGLYHTLDLAPAKAQIAQLNATQAFDECNGCELDVGKSLHADRVMVGWVQKVSNLILNLNVRIEDVATGQVVMARSVDMRGNTDQSWSRSVSYLVHTMKDAHEGNR